MLSRLIAFSLHNRFVVLVLALVLLACGIFVAAQSPMDVFPKFAPPQVQVETEAPGLSAEEVEALLMGLLALVGVFLLLFTDFRSGRLAALVLVNLPLALIGGIAAALLFRVTLSLGALVGFVTLFGITARNAIMLLSRYRHLEEREGLRFGPELVIQGSLDRLSPVLMTALVTGLALLPLVIGGSRAGQEIEYPMAVVIVGGLSSTALNLLLMPAFYLLLRSRERSKASRARATPSSP